MQAYPDESYLGERCLISEIKMAGHWRYSRPQTNRLPPHVHASAFEICYIADGVADWWVEDQTFEIRAGQFFVTKPSELHGGVNSTAMPTEIYWIQIVPPDNGPFAGLTEDETVRLRDGLWSIAGRVFDATADPSPLYNRLLTCLRQDSEFRALSLRLALHGLLLRILEDAPRSTLREHLVMESGSSRIDLACGWIDRHLTEEFTVDDVARACGVAASYLHKTFAATIGVTPGGYRLRGRIALAKRRLKEDNYAITRIAIDLGFSSSQYFATVFKSQTGMTPFQYRCWSRQDTPPCRMPAYVD